MSRNNILLVHSCYHGNSYWCALPFGLICSFPYLCCSGQFLCHFALVWPAEVWALQVNLSAISNIVMLVADCQGALCWIHWSNYKDLPVDGGICKIIPALDRDFEMNDQINLGLCVCLWLRKLLFTVEANVLIRQRISVKYHFSCMSVWVRTISDKPIN